MYCPNCGQQQISEEMRFCSRCGLALTGLAEWLAGGGVVPAQSKKEKKVSVDSPRRKGIRRAAKLMFFSGVLFPIFFAIAISENKGEPIIFPIILFFVSLAMMLYARLFSDNTAPAPAQLQAAAQTSALRSTPARSSLPPAKEVVMPAVGRTQVRTNELAQPPSVTEHTTKLLDNE